MNKKIGTEGNQHVGLDSGEGRASRAVIYARARVLPGHDQGRASQAEARQAHEQIKRCEEEAIQLGAPVAQTYIDLGVSADDQSRPALLALLERLRTKRDVDYIIVSALDRMAHKAEDELTLARRFDADGARLVVAGQGVHDLSSAAEVLETIQQIFDGLKRREMSEAAKRAWARRRAGAAR